MQKLQGSFLTTTTTTSRSFSMLLRLVVTFSVLVVAVVSLSPPPSSSFQHRKTTTTATTTTTTAALANNNHVDNNECATTTTTTTRRSLLLTLGTTTTTSLLPSVSMLLLLSSMMYPSPASAKCTDIESCREIGDKKIEQDLKENPVTILKSGVRYKQLKPGFGDKTISFSTSSSSSGDSSSSTFVDLIYSISTGGGVYMYSRGFGYEKMDVGSGPQPDTSALDSYRVTLGKGDLPIGIEQALVGMKKGERRRIELPPNVGFETSNWKPEPTTRNGKQRIKNYQTLLNGVGTNRPPFPAPTIWDVEVLSFR